MFGSTTIVGHIVRGLIGIGALAAAVVAPSPYLSLVAIPVALVAFRGCPMCWTFGLVETVAATWRRRPREDICMDGCGSRKEDSP
jgi:hypothetical protein